MFHSSSYIRRIEQEKHLDQLYFRAAEKRSNYYSMHMPALVEEMIADFYKLKSTLNTAANEYLTIIAGKWFRDSGRLRVSIFRTEINQANTVNELVLALQGVIKKGNEDEDSFKTLLYKRMDKVYNISNIHIYGGITDFLELTVNEMFRQTSKLEEVKLKIP